jgi:selenocysteine lyase/cysteine desulfurase
MNDLPDFPAAARQAFDVPANVIYLNCASLAPRLHSVTAAGRMAIDRMAAPWKIRGSDWFDDARSLSATFARLIDAPAHCATLVPSVSYGIAVAARNVPVSHGQNIVLIEGEYPSNVYSWQRLASERGAQIRCVAPAHDLTLTDAIIQAIDRSTAVVAVANCRWTDGLAVDLVRVGEAVRRHNAALVVDASQSLGASPLSVAECQPDFLVCVGYKWLLGPYALGYLYVAERWHEHGEPLEESWLHRAGSEDFASLTYYTDRYNPGAERFGQGESAQFYLLPMALAALSQIEQWTVMRIHQHLRSWTDELALRARAIGLSAPDPAQRLGHMIGLRWPHGLPQDLAAKLAAHDIYVSIRGNCMRVAPHLHVGGDAIERLLSALQAVVD